MSNPDYLTDRGSLLATMEHSRQSWGYLVEGCRVTRDGRRWWVDDAGPFASFTDALYFVADMVAWAS